MQKVQRDPTWSVSGFTACVLQVPDTFQVTEFALLEPSGDVIVSGGLDTSRLQVSHCPPDA